MENDKVNKEYDEFLLYIRKIAPPLIVSYPVFLEHFLFESIQEQMNDTINGLHLFQAYNDPQRKYRYILKGWRERFELIAHLNETEQLSIQNTTSVVLPLKESEILAGRRLFSELYSRCGL